MVAILRSAARGDFPLKRIFLSFGYGVLLSILYLLLVVLVVWTVKLFNVTLHGDSWWFQVLIFPLEWGGQLYSFLFPPQFENPYALLRSPAILFDIVGCVLIFALLAYLLIRWRPRRARFE
jgi:hypothetical protein